MLEVSFASLMKHHTLGICENVHLIKEIWIVIQEVGKTTFSQRYITFWRKNNILFI